MEILGPIFILLVILLGIISLILYGNWMKKKADMSCSEIREALETEKWKTVFQYYGMTHQHLNGNFKLRKIKSNYVITNFGTKKLQLSSVPNTIPKKIPWYKFRSSYPIVYKNFIFDGKKISTQLNLELYENGKISKEEASSLLEDLIHACEIIEKGEYEI